MDAFVRVGLGEKLCVRSKGRVVFRVSGCVGRNLSGQGAKVWTDGLADE